MQCPHHPECFVAKDYTCAKCDKIIDGYMDQEKAELRTITFKGNVYIRAEDVADYILSLGSSEETDTRNRLKQAADNIRSMKP